MLAILGKCSCAVDENTVDNALEAAKFGSNALEHVTEVFNKLAGPMAEELGRRILAASLGR